MNPLQVIGQYWMGDGRCGYALLKEDIIYSFDWVYWSEQIYITSTIETYDFLGRLLLGCAIYDFTILSHLFSDIYILNWNKVEITLFFSNQKRTHWSYFQ